MGPGIKHVLVTANGIAINLPDPESSSDCLWGYSPKAELAGIFFTSGRSFYVPRMLGIH